MAQYMPFWPVLDVIGGNLKIAGTGASTANQHKPHFADDGGFNDIQARACNTLTFRAVARSATH